MNNVRSEIQASGIPLLLSPGLHLMAMIRIRLCPEEAHITMSFINLLCHSSSTHLSPNSLQIWGEKARKPFLRCRFACQSINAMVGNNMSKCASTANCYPITIIIFSTSNIE